MPKPPEPLPPQVLDALRRRDAVEAIKLLRQSKGLGIKEAKERIEQHIRAARPPLNAAVAPAGSVPAKIAEALQRGDKAEAMRLARTHAAPGLKEAWTTIAALRASKASGRPSGLSPGEVRDSGAGNGWFVVLAAAALAVFYFLRG
jgi:ribosomal protein L7/L12